MKVYDEKKVAPKPNVFLKLEQDNDDVLLVAVDENGQQHSAAYLMRFSNEGVLLCTSINPLLGLPLGEYGKLKLRCER